MRWFGLLAYTRAMSLTSDDLADIKQLLLALENRLDRRFDEVDKRFDEVDKRFSDQDEQLNEILNAVGGDLEEKDEQIIAHNKQLKNHESRILHLESQVS